MRRRSAASPAGSAGREALQHGIDGRAPAGGVGEVDAFEQRVQAFAGHRAAREAQDVVGAPARLSAGVDRARRVTRRSWSTAASSWRAPCASAL